MTSDQHEHHAEWQLRLRTIAEQPRENRAALYAELCDELRAHLEHSDLPENDHGSPATAGPL